MSDHKYRLLYKVEVPEKPLAENEVPPEYGATDALLLVSCLYPDDGSFSTAIVPIDGRPGQPLNTDESVLGDDEVFKIWSMMAKHLSESKTLGPGKKGFAKVVFEQIREAVLSNR